MQHEESDQEHVREVKREANKWKYFKERTTKHVFRNRMNNWND